MKKANASLRKKKSREKTKKAAPRRSPRKKKVKAKESTKKAAPRRSHRKKQTAPPTLKHKLEVGMKISGKWFGKRNHGQWFDGVIKSIDHEVGTCHVVYTDGDEDECLPWTDISVTDLKDG